jgi:hypothetical protein
MSDFRECPQCKAKNLVTSVYCSACYFKFAHKDKPSSAPDVLSTPTTISMKNGGNSRGIKRVTILTLTVLAGGGWFIFSRTHEKGEAVREKLSIQEDPTGQTNYSVSQSTTIRKTTAEPKLSRYQLLLEKVKKEYENRIAEARDQAKKTGIKEFELKRDMPELYVSFENLPLEKREHMMRSAYEKEVFGNLANIRAAISIYYSEHDNKAPASLDSVEFISKFNLLESLPPAFIYKYHEESNYVMYGGEPNDQGGWMYDPRTGNVRINCTHTSQLQKGRFCDL